MKTIHWGMIGAGDVTEKKSGPAFRKAGYSDLVAIMRRNADKAKAYAKRHGVAKWYSDAEKLIKDPEVEAIYVATPPYMHARYAIWALTEGKPVYVEKPMAMNYSECKDILFASEHSGVPAFVAHYRRALPYFQKIKELLDQQVLGDLRTVTFQLYHPVQEMDMQQQVLPWRYQPEIAGGGLFFDLAPHQLDLMDFFFGPVQEVGGVATNQAGLYRPEDAVSASFVCENHIVGSAVWNFTMPQGLYRDEAEITGTKGRLTFSFFNQETPIRVETGDMKEEFAPEFPEHIQQPLIQTIVNELNNQGKCPADMYSGARTAWVMDEIVKHYKEILKR